MANTKISALTQASANSSSAVPIVRDGSTYKTSPYSLYYAGVANNAAAHNAVYRGEDITSRHNNGSLSSQVQAGDFTDIFIGDYITATTTANGSTVTTKWRVADIDYYINTGNTTDIDANHHLVLVPDACMFNAYMNSTNVTTGGYQGSEMWKTYIPMCVTAIKNAFGASRVLPWRTALSNVMNSDKLSMAGDGWTGASSMNWDTGWVTAEADLMSEAQVYGCGVFSSSYADYWMKKTQFSLFRLNRTAMNIRADYWLSSVASGTGFAYCDWGCQRFQCLWCSWGSSAFPVPLIGEGAVCPFQKITIL